MANLSGSLFLMPWCPKIKDSYTDKISLTWQKQQLQQEKLLHINKVLLMETHGNHKSSILYL